MRRYCGDACGDDCSEYSGCPWVSTPIHTVTGKQKPPPVSHVLLVIEAGLAPQSSYTKCVLRHIGDERGKPVGDVCLWHNRVYYRATQLGRHCVPFE